MAMKNRNQFRMLDRDIKVRKVGHLGQETAEFVG